MRHRKLAVATILLIIGSTSVGQAGWIWIKALLAQQLLERSWEKAQQGANQVHPWPWADTFPVARLEAPDHNVDLIVLEGVSGRSLAFGPGYMTGSALPGTKSNTVIAGHRDTHFRFLQDLEIGDELLLETLAGARRRYQVTATQIIDVADRGTIDLVGPSRLTLVTCYPFDSLVPGGTLRYIVTAEPRHDVES